jgi:hypothetical protein
MFVEFFLICHFFAGFAIVIILTCLSSSLTHSQEFKKASWHEEYKATAQISLLLDSPATTSLQAILDVDNVVAAGRSRSAVFLEVALDLV